MKPSMPLLSLPLLTNGDPTFRKLLDSCRLPEKVIQFGAGVLLRGLPDYYINRANQSGFFQGSIVVVKSTAQGDTDAFRIQDNVFSHTLRGVEGEKIVDETTINTAVSRILSASVDWREVLACAHNPDIRIVISNTTEIGIEFIEDDVFAFPPVSFPGKLTAYLYERFLALGDTVESGMIIVPTELITDNGDKLREIVVRQANANNLPVTFIAWVLSCNKFCNSLVDRIVTGRPDKVSAEELSRKLGFEDNLSIVSEVYGLWAIQGDQQIASLLSFHTANEGLLIQPSINDLREMKLRLLNGTHSLITAYCFLQGLDTVGQSMQDSKAKLFISELMLNEIGLAISQDISGQRILEYCRQVLDRFRNPFIRHHLLDISVQYTTKMKMRTIPILLNYYDRHGHVPKLFCKGFAAYIRFMKPEFIENETYYGIRNGKKYPIRCVYAQYFYETWRDADSELSLVKMVLSNSRIWDCDLVEIEGFVTAVLQELRSYHSEDGIIHQS